MWRSIRFEVGSDSGWFWCGAVLIWNSLVQFWFIWFWLDLVLISLASILFASFDSVPALSLFSTTHLRLFLFQCFTYSLGFLEENKHIQDTSDTTTGWTNKDNGDGTPENHDSNNSSHTNNRTHLVRVGSRINIAVVGVLDTQTEGVHCFEPRLLPLVVEAPSLRSQKGDACYPRNFGNGRQACTAEVKRTRGATTYRVERKKEMEGGGGGG